MNKRKSSLLKLSLAAGVSFLLINLHASVTVVARPDTSATNNFYLSNRAPLEPSEFIPLPIDSVQAKGWLLTVLKRQRDGLSGHLGEISIWLEKD
ncbi:MAG: hypothetical protein ABSE48_06510, partial [Verrucomicrobiota bacterium]